MMGYQGKIRLLIVVLLTLALLACGGGGISGGKTSSGGSSGELGFYQKSLSAYQNKDYSSAITLFEEQLQKFPSGNYAVNAHYYEGRSSYAISNYVNALKQFQILLVQFKNDPLFDSAQYWKAKTYHKQGQFDLARTEYAKVNSQSKWADNAAYQTGKTHFDQAAFTTITDLVAAYGEYSVAIKLLKAMITNPIYATSSSLDSARYFLGRSFQEQGDLLQKNSALVPPLSKTETSTSQFTAALAEFTKVGNTSIYFDDASYQSARIDYMNAKIVTKPVTAYPKFEIAINSFRVFINNSAFLNSNRLDDAFYYLAQGLQQRGYLLQKNLTALTKAGLLTTATGECVTAADCLLNARTEYARIAVTSVFYDDGLYFTARSYHKEGNLIAARAAYKLLVNSNTSNWADDSKYLLGKLYYDGAQLKTDPRAAILEYESAYNEFNTLAAQFPDSTRIDSALFYKGRSAQQQALLVQTDVNLSNITATALFNNARLTFQKLLDTQPLSKWADNALHQQAGCYYDEAKFATLNINFPAAQDSLSLAIGLWRKLLAHPVYKTQSSADNAQFSLGQSFQLVLSVPMVDRIQANGVNFKIVTSNSSILEYNKVITNFSGSRWVDNSYYNIAVIYNTDALAATRITDKQIAFSRSLLNFDKVVKKYPGQSHEDDAAKRIAMIYHDVGGSPLKSYCLAEQNWFTYLLKISVDTVLRNTADSHLADLTVAAPLKPVKHTCVAANKLNLIIYSTP